jgi:parallel beta-helix repeat protein
VNRFAYAVTALALTVLVHACGSSSTSTAPTTIAVGAGGETIQAAVNAAANGATITIGPGTFAEHLTIAKPIKLQANQAVLDGLAGTLDGRDVGIHVLSNDVEITGFTVQNFERGIVIDHVANCLIHGNEVRNNTSKDPQPITAGVTKADGIALLQAQNGDVSENFVHDNGAVGLLLVLSSGGNTIRANRFVNNGTQQIPSPGGGQYGTGIYSGGGNDTRNMITDNDISNSHWGILIGSGADSANIIQNNRIHNNGRAGIAVFGQHNQIQGNDVTGNGGLNLPPSCRLDLVDYYGLDNTWLDNLGNFGTDIVATRSSCPF